MPPRVNRSSPKEKRTLANLFFGLGKRVRIEGKNGKPARYITRTAENEWRDELSYRPVPIEEIADDLLKPSTRLVTERDLLEFKTLARTRNTHRRKVFIDTETRIKSNTGRLVKEDTLQVAFKIKGENKGHSLIFSDIAKQHKTLQGAPSDPIHDMPKALDQQYEQMDKFYTPHGRSEFMVDDNALGIKMHVNMINRSEYVGKSKRIFDPTKHQGMAYNSSFDEARINAMSGPENQIQLDDLRGFASISYARHMPEVDEVYMKALTTNFKPLLKKMNITDDATALIVDNARHGLGSQYTSATALEDLHYINQGTLGPHAQKLKTGRLNDDFTTQTHEGVGDNILAENAYSDTKQLNEMMRREKMGLFGHDPNRRYFSTADRRAYFWMRQAYAREAVANPNSVWQTVAEFNKAWDRAAGKDGDPVMVARRIKANLEIKQGIKIEKGIFKGTKGSLGGPGTVGALLGGAALSAGVKWAVTKASMRAGEGQDQVPEGLGHNSLMTVARRLALTDFHSSWSSGISQAAGAFVKIIGGSMRMMKNSPTGKAVGEAFSAILGSPKYQGSGDITKGAVKSWFGGGGGTKHMQTIMSKIQCALGKMATSASENVHLTDKARENVSGFFQKAAEKVAELGTSVPTDKSLLTEGTVKFKKTLSDLFAMRGGKLPPHAIAAMAGIGGAVLLGVTTGKYDPDKAPEVPETLDKNKVRNPQRHRRTPGSLWQRLNDLRSTQDEGIRYGSPTRQQQRYSKTDFGSGMRPRRTLDEMITGGSFPTVQKSVIDGAHGVHGVETARTNRRNVNLDRANIQSSTVQLKSGKSLQISGKLSEAINSLEDGKSMLASEAISESLENRKEETATKLALVRSKSSHSEARKMKMYTSQYRPHQLPDESMAHKSMKRQLVGEGPGPFYRGKDLYGGSLSGIDGRMRRQVSHNPYNATARGYEQIIPNEEGMVNRQTTKLDDSISSASIVPRRIIDTGNKGMESADANQYYTRRNVSRNSSESDALDASDSRDYLKPLRNANRIQGEVQSEINQGSINNAVMMNQGGYPDRIIAMSLDNKGLQDAGVNMHINRQEMSGHRIPGWASSGSKTFNNDSNIHTTENVT